MNNIKQLLGLAKRAGKLQTGEQALISIQKKQTSLIFLANDASDNTKKKVPR